MTTGVGSFKSFQTQKEDLHPWHNEYRPAEHVRAEIDALFSSDQDLSTVLEDVGRLTVRLLMQQAIEAEVDTFLGRRPYERRGEDTPAGCATAGSRPWR